MKLRFLVSAGPTREAIDPVRYLSNASSGRTGFAVAAAAARRGHEVTLVSGPVAIAAPPGVLVEHVGSAREMQAAMRRFARAADVIVMAAAVADYRPRRVWPAKLKKTRATLTLELVRNPDILAGLARRKGRRVVIGFALETGDLERRAHEKLVRKRLDMIVANGPGNLDGAHAAVTLIDAAGRASRHELSKTRLGVMIVRRGEEIHALKREGKRR
jgi:phosphopantothenoylcysteine decarboxylase / phosphopantothenate---cysteine ligase